MQTSIGGSFRIKGGGAYDLTHVILDDDDNQRQSRNGGNHNGKEKKYQGIWPVRL